MALVVIVVKDNITLCKSSQVVVVQNGCINATIAALPHNLHNLWMTQ